MLSIDYFRAIQNSNGIYSEPEAKIAEAQQRLSRELKGSINYKANATRNGARQDIVLVPYSKVKYKCQIIAFPNQELYVGDVISIDDLNWIIVETNTTNPIQTSGTAWLCNHLFRFQNRTSKILEYWGVIDDGSYANPQDGSNQIKYLNHRVDFYLPYNNDTKYLYVDKRIATDTTYDQYGDEILEVYKIEGKKQSLNTYGKGGHLLVLEAVSGQYSPDRDNIAEGICDYIHQKDTNAKPNLDLLKCEIKGRTKIRTGSYGNYTVVFEGSDKNIVPKWSLETTFEGIKMNPSENSVEIVVDDLDILAGEVLILSCQDMDGKYNPAKIEIEVI